MTKLGKVLLEACVQLSTSANPVSSMDTACYVNKRDLQREPRVMASRMVARVYFLQDEARVLIKPGMHLMERKSSFKEWLLVWTPLPPHLLEQIEKEADELRNMSIEDAESLHDKAFLERVKQRNKAQAGPVTLDTWVHLGAMLLGLELPKVDRRPPLHEPERLKRMPKKGVKVGKLSRAERLAQLRNAANKGTSHSDDDKAVDPLKGFDFDAHGEPDSLPIMIPFSELTRAEKKAILADMGPKERRMKYREAIKFGAKNPFHDDEALRPEDFEERDRAVCANDSDYESEEVGDEPDDNQGVRDRPYTEM